VVESRILYDLASFTGVKVLPRTSLIVDVPLAEFSMFVIARIYAAEKQPNNSDANLLQS